MRCGILGFSCLRLYGIPRALPVELEANCLARDDGETVLPQMRSDSEEQNRSRGALDWLPLAAWED